MQDPAPPQPKTPLPLLVGVTVVTGIGAGLGGMLLALLLHFIQHVAYGYSLSAVVSPESFLQGVTAASPMRRVLVLAICGLVGGVGWWAVYRYCRPLVSIKKAIGATDPRMPIFATVAHALLQIVTVALGSPLGRETAPREIGSVFAGWLSHRAGLTPADSRIMVACGAGAGLAAVYNVPFGGAIFVLEVLLGTFSLPALLPALTTSVIAALVAWIGLGDEALFKTLHFTISPSLIVWSIVTGPVFGFSAYWFTRLSTAARAEAPRDRRLILWCLGIFLAIGLLSIPFPQLLGNGKGPTQLGFDNDLSAGLAATLFLFKLVVTAGCLRAGADGGLLTPGLTLGGLLAIVIGGFWSLAWPDVPSGAFAVVGAAAFLAASMKMPLTAIALIIEFTRVDHDFLFPIFFGVVGSVATFQFCAQLYAEPLRQSLLPVGPAWRSIVARFNRRTNPVETPSAEDPGPQPLL
jgi:H+/Cl- antiporter ClcA